MVWGETTGKFRQNLDTFSQVTNGTRAQIETLMRNNEELHKRLGQLEIEKGDEIAY